MKDFLRRIKLIDSMTTTLPISKIQFVNRLHEITDVGSTAMMLDTFEAFSSSKKEFKGQINFDNFKIRKRKRFFETNKYIAVATGTFDEKGGQLTVETEINGFSDFYIVFYAFLIIIYSILIIAFSTGLAGGGFSFLPFIIIHGTLMFCLPYFMMKRSVRNLKYELEREFFYLTKSI